MDVSQKNWGLGAKQGYLWCTTSSKVITGKFGQWTFSCSCTFSCHIFDIEPLFSSWHEFCYRGVGFLKYFQFKQLPNFLLASPVLSLAVCSIISYTKSRPELFLSLGFQATEKEKRSSTRLYSLKYEAEPDVKASPNEGIIFSFRSETVPKLSIDEHSPFSWLGNHDIRQRKPSRKKDVTVTNVAAESNSPEKSGYFSADVFPFVVHLGFMAATAFFVMHVQVTILNIMNRIVLRIYRILGEMKVSVREVVVRCPSRVCVVVITGCDTVLVSKPSSLLVCRVFETEEMEILDMVILCSLHPSWLSSLLKLLSLHMINGFSAVFYQSIVTWIYWFLVMYKQRTNRFCCVCRVLAN